MYVPEGDRIEIFRVASAKLMKLTLNTLANSNAETSAEAVFFRAIPDVNRVVSR